MKSSTKNVELIFAIEKAKNFASENGESDTLRSKLLLICEELHNEQNGIFCNSQKYDSDARSDPYHNLFTIINNIRISNTKKNLKHGCKKLFKILFETCTELQIAASKKYKNVYHIDVNDMYADLISVIDKARKFTISKGPKADYQYVRSLLVCACEEFGDISYKPNKKDLPIEEWQKTEECKNFDIAISLNEEMEKKYPEWD